MCGILLALCAARLVNQRPAGGDSVQITQKMRLPGGDIDICIVCSALIHKEWLIIQMARRRIIKPRQRWTNQPTHSPQFQLSVPPGGGVCTSDINDMTPCLVADYIISLHTSHCLQHCSTADTAGALLQTSLDPARDTRGHLASGPADLNIFLMSNMSMFQKIAKIIYRSSA